MKPSEQKPILQRFKAVLLHPISVILGTAILVAPFFYFCAFTHPANDDFGSVRWTNNFDYQRNIFLHWTGRYFSTAIISLDPIHWHWLAGYKLAAAILLLLFATISIYLIARIITLFSNIDSRKRLFLSCAGLILLLNNFPSLAEGIYWYCGAITYTLGALLLAAFILLVLQIEEEKNFKISVGKGFIATLLLIASVGSNETLIPITVMLCFFLFIFYRNAQEKVKVRFYFLMLLVCLISSAVAILAPGNFVRRNIAPPNLYTAIPAWLSWSYSWWKELLFDPFLIIFTTLFLIVRKDFQFRRKLPPLLVLFLLPAFVVLAASFPSFWSMGHQPPYRTLDAIFMIFIFAWIPFALKLSGEIHDFLKRNPERSTLTKALLVVLISGFIFISTTEHIIRKSNYFMAIKNLANHTGQDYDAFLKQRYLLVKNSNNDTIFVPPIPQKHGNILFFADLNTDPTKFPNPDFAAWLGKKFVARIPDSVMAKNGH